MSYVCTHWLTDAALFIC